jgi:hypothetical protein
MTHFLKFFLIVITFFSCANRVQVTDVSSRGIEIQVCSKTPKELINKWMWSREEDKGDGIRVYRPSTYDFPLTRARTGVEFFKNGKFTAYEIGADDKPIQYEGQWIYDKKSKTMEISFKHVDIRAGLMPTTTEPRKPLVVEIIYLDKDMIKAKIRDEKTMTTTDKY